MSEATTGYLKYLPAVYSKEAELLLAPYLKIFEKLLTGVDDAQLDGRKGIQQLLSANVIGNLFYPRLSFLFPADDTAFIPPISGATSKEETAILAELNSYIGAAPDTTSLNDFLAAPQVSGDWQAACEQWLNDFLRWLGGWTALTVSEDWDIDKKRTVIAESMALYRQRGTAQGLGFMLDLVLDLPLAMTGVEYVNGVSQPITGNLTVAVSNPVLPCITSSDDAKNAFMLQDSYLPGSAVVSGYAPWCFNVLVTLPNYQNDKFILTKLNIQTILALLASLRHILDRMKPAGSRYAITVQPSMLLQSQPTGSTLGVNTLLGT